MKDMVLVKATLVIDDETGAGNAGDFDFGIPATTIVWLDAGHKEERAEALARHLEWLAGQCRARKQPFNRHGEWDKSPETPAEWMTAKKG